MREDLFTPTPPLEAAQRRLELALDALAERARALKAAPPPASPSRDAERKRLEAELESAHTRERQLEQVAAEASAALGRAAAEVRAALAAEA